MLICVVALTTPPNPTNQIRAWKSNSVLRNASIYAKNVVHTVLMFATGDPVNVPKTW